MARRPMVFADQWSAHNEQFSQDSVRVDCMTASWVIVSKATGKPVMETFKRSTMERVNTERYRVVPIMEWLQEFNRSVKA